MQRIAIIGTGPTGIYTLAGLIKCRRPLAITLYESRAQAGVGMPFDDKVNHPIMLANIASIEIPAPDSTYLQWLKAQGAEFLERHGVCKDDLHDRQFLPRVLLGHYFAAQLHAIVSQGIAAGHDIQIKVNTTVNDITAGQPLRLWLSTSSEPKAYDYVAIATGHEWPKAREKKPCYFPSPWSGLIHTPIPATDVGIMGTSLSGIDAAMAVAIQHGRFVESNEGKTLAFELKESSRNLRISMLSRSGLLPEADFYCPIPHEPLAVATPEAIQEAIDQGPEGLLNRVFSLMVRELTFNDPAWSSHINLHTLTPDSFTDAYYESRKKHNPFYWASHNLEEVERNKKNRHTIAWRYTLLRLHEAIEPIVPHLNHSDLTRFNQSLKRVFIDNYAAVPSESIRRLLALRQAGVIELKALGHNYELTIKETKTYISTESGTLNFDIFIDARGQRSRRIDDLPFPSLKHLLVACEGLQPPIDTDYTLQAKSDGAHRIALAALPYLMPIKPFVQGITVCAEIGDAVSKGFIRSVECYEQALSAEHEV
ncbi:FAD/NAD(P)-binding protein [Gilvimarinus chinensis]|uniref:FAD/NAD(P)-binding protein n=1 Tax=Gilvimarinus chinensis TaxID=396005 RepID=UPI000380509C|nr:FAD/NAD(P)-binding protein [Gilvimarinus chinensis]